MKHGTWYVAFAFASMWLGAACSSEEPPGSQGQTHWLRECESDTECGELSCECGRCVAGCDDGASCDVAGRSTSCQSASSGAVAALCGSQRASAMCLEPCGDGCATGQRCVSGACIPAVSTGMAGSGAGAGDGASAGQGESGRGGGAASGRGGVGGGAAGAGNGGTAGQSGRGGAGVSGAGQGGASGAAGEPDPQDAGSACLPRAERCTMADDRCCAGSRCVQTACTASIPPSCIAECMPDTSGGKPDAGGASGEVPCGPSLRCNRATEVCVSHQAFMTTFACKPVPASCGGKATCECVVDSLCEPSFKTCNDDKAGEIACICIAC